MSPISLIGVWGTTVALAAILTVFGYTAYPVVVTDAAHHYLLPAICLKAGMGLINPYSLITLSIDPAGAGRFLMYPPLMQQLLALLMTEATGPAVLRTVGWISGSSLVGFALFMVTWIRRKSPEASGPAVVSLLFGLVGFAGILNQHHLGRPEILGTVFLLLGSAAAFYATPTISTWILGMAWGAMAASYPPGAVLCAPFIGLFLYFHKEKIFLRSASLLVSTAATFALCLAISPYPISDLLAGLARHKATNGPPNFSLQDFWQWYLFNPSIFFGGAVAIMGLMAVLRLRQRALNISLLFYLPFLIIPSLRFYVRWQYLMFLMPVYLFFLISSTPRASRLWCAGVWLVLGISGLGFWRSLATFPTFLHQGVSLTQARENFREMISHYPPETKFGVPPSLWVLTESYSRIFYCESFPPPQKNVVILKQHAYDQSPHRGNAETYEMVKAFGEISAAAPFWMQKGTIPGYGFSVYAAKPTKRE